MHWKRSKLEVVVVLFAMKSIWTLNFGVSHTERDVCVAAKDSRKNEGNRWVLFKGTKLLQRENFEIKAKTFLFNFLLFQLKMVLESMANFQWRATEFYEVVVTNCEMQKRNILIVMSKWFLKLNWIELNWNRSKYIELQV